jgi:hypothetical protein
MPGITVALQNWWWSWWIAALIATGVGTPAFAQGMAQGPPVPPTAKTAKCKAQTIPQLEDVTDKAGIHFEHNYSREGRSILESMAGGVLLLDYDRDGWLDIYFTNAPTVGEALEGKKARGALYHNNHDGTFTDVTDRAGIGTPCFAMGGAVGDYDNDGWPDIYVTCYGGNVLYHNNGDGTFTDVTRKAGVRDGRWSTGAAFGDYDGDGFADMACYVPSQNSYELRESSTQSMSQPSWSAGTYTATGSWKAAPAITYFFPGWAQRQTFTYMTKEYIWLNGQLVVVENSPHTSQVYGY